jgi:protease-4
MARGRVWSGLAAHRGGLVDELGGLDRAIAIARERAGIKEGEEHELVLYPGRGLFAGLRAIASGAQMPMGFGLAADALGWPRRWAPAMLALLMRGGALVFCPFF